MASTREKILANAQRYLEKGNLARAIKEYGKVLEIQPDDIRTRLRIGDLQARLGQRNEAITTYEGVAREYFARGFFPKAVAVYKQILRLDPNRTDIQLQLAQLYLQMNLLSDSLAQFREVAESFRKLGKTDDLVHILLQIIDIDPFDIPARINLGEYYSSRGQIMDAAEHFAVAADQLRELNHIDDYIKVAERYFFHRPDDVDRLKELVQVYLRREDFKRALAKLQLIFKTAEKDPQALRYLADAFLGLKKRERAVRVLKELAELHVEKGQEELAVEVYQRVFTLDPDDLDARIHLGLSLPPRYAHQAVGAGRPAGAGTGPLPMVPDEADLAEPDTEKQWGREAAAAGLFTYPGNIISLNRLLTPEQLNLIYRLLVEGDSHLRTGTWGRGMEVLTQALRIDPDNISARERLVQMYLHQGMVLDSIGQLLHMARSCWRADPARAARYLHQGLRLDPNHPGANALRSELGLDQVDLAAFRRDAAPQATGPQEVTSQVRRQDVGYDQPPYETPPSVWDQRPAQPYDREVAPADSQPGGALPGVLGGYDEITKVAPTPEARRRVPPDMGWAKSFSSQWGSPTSSYTYEPGAVSPSPTPHMPGYAPDEPTGVYTTGGEPVYQPEPAVEAEGELDELFLDAYEADDSGGEEPVVVGVVEAHQPMMPSHLVSPPAGEPADQQPAHSDTHPLFGRRRIEPEGAEDLVLPPAASAPTSIVFGQPDQEQVVGPSTPQPPEPIVGFKPSAGLGEGSPTVRTQKPPESPKEEPPRPKVELPPLPDDLPGELRDELMELEILMSSNQRGSAQDLMFDMTMNYPEYTPLIMERMALLEGQES